jgi:hypothetical protein
LILDLREAIDHQAATFLERGALGVDARFDHGSSVRSAHGIPLQFHVISGGSICRLVLRN